MTPKDELDLLLHTITDDDILSRVNQCTSDEEKYNLVFREEVMKTVIDGRYSGLCCLTFSYVYGTFEHNV